MPIIHATEHPALRSTLAIHLPEKLPAEGWLMFLGEVPIERCGHDDCANEDCIEILVQYPLGDGGLYIRKLAILFGKRILENMQLEWLATLQETDLPNWETLEVAPEEIEHVLKMIELDYSHTYIRRS
ncbi:MAG TPA: hypothetical protein VFZ58_05680 [Candidatus Saccharimonadales bacterium]